MTRPLKVLVFVFASLGYLWLCWYAWHAHPPKHRAMTEGEFVAQKLAEYHPPGDSGAVYRTARDCGENWLCLLEWAQEANPRRQQ
jgi:hypothetical protein